MATDNAQTGSSKPISQLKSAEDLSKKMDSLRNARSRKERDWKLNLAFYRGNQYAYWNPGSKRIESLPTEDGEKPRYRVRITSNQIVLGVQSVLSKLIKTKPMWSATPAQPGDKAVKVAQFSEDILNDWWVRFDMARKYEEACLWSLIADNGYWKLSWDAFAATEMRFLVDPQSGQPIVDEALSKEFRAQLEAQGIDPKEVEQVAYMGDVKIEVMSPFDIFIDPAAKSVEEAKWAICAHHLEPDEIKVRWPKSGEIKPDKVAAGPDEALPSQGGQGSGLDPTLKTVYVGYFKKTPQLPNGRYVVFIEDPDTILYDSAWPFPMNTLPLVQFRGIPVPGSTQNDSVVTHARPIQKQINRLLSQITEYTNMVIKPRVWAPVNSLRQRLTTEPGAVYEYTPVGNFRPEIEQLPSIPPYVFTFLEDLGARMRDVFGLTEVTEGQLPPNLEAADAIDLLQEMATDRFAPSIIANEHALARAGQFLLSLAQEFYAEPRLLTIRGLGGMTSVREFSQADFAGEVMVRVESGSSLPRTRAARRKQVEQWMQLGLITPDRAWKHYDIADVKDLAVEFARDEDHALREHDKIIAGTPLNPEAMQQAMAAVQQGINPETQQPIQSPDEVQNIMLRASLMPGTGDNDQTHADKHRGLIVSTEFENHSPEVRQRFLTHYELTKQKLAAQPHGPEPQAPRVSLQLRGAVTPTAEAQILRASGVDVDPQTLMQEPPMETVVMDSVDKPDTDSGGAGQEAEHLSNVAQAVVQTQIANADAQQKYAHQEVGHHQSTAHAATAEQRTQEAHDQQLRHAEELHQQKLKTMQAQAKQKPQAKPKGN